MNRKERRAAKKNAGPEMSPTAATLAQAFRAHQSGHRSDAERLYRDVLAIEPRNAPALHLLGALMHQTGHSEDAVSLMRQAIAIEPRNPDYHYNLGSVLNATGRMPEAIEQLSKAIALKPQYAEAHFEIGNAYGRIGRFESAEKSLRRALELMPANAAVMNNLGRALRALRRPEDAVAVWQRAVTLHPDLAIAHLNIGLVRHEQNRLGEAEESLRRALAAQADYPEAVQQLAAVLISRGRAHEAIPLLAAALARTESADLKAAFAQCLLAVQELHPDAELRNLLRRAIEEAWIRPAMLVPLGMRILKAHATIGAAIRRISEQWGKVPASQLLPTDAEIHALAQEQLVRVLLEAAPNVDIDIERLLTVLRAAMLGHAQRDNNPAEPVLALRVSLARQCFINEYVFAESEDERSRVHALQTAIGKAIGSNDAIAPSQVAALAAYRPFYRIDGAAALLERNWPPSVAALLQQQITAPMQEAALQADLPALTPVTPPGEGDQQRGPSPRWVKAMTTLQPLSVEDVVRTCLQTTESLSLDLPDAPDVLIAPCGTGQRAIEAVLSYGNARVLAVGDDIDDLAYGRRQAENRNLQGITFARADIAGLGSTGRTFDVIEASGLYSLADPWAAWSALVALLREGGVMRIALLSETAYRELAAVRDFVKQGNYHSDEDGIRVLRQNLLRLPADNPAVKAILSPEFFATESCRALAFGLQDQKIMLPQVQDFLAANNLELLGVETSAELQQAFAKRFPEAGARASLAAWQAFERERADTFVASYQLWLRKPRASPASSA